MLVTDTAMGKQGKARGKGKVKSRRSAKACTSRPPNLSFRLCQYKETISAPLDNGFHGLVRGFVERAFRARAPKLVDLHVCGGNLYKSIDSFYYEGHTISDVLRITEGHKSFWVKGRASVAG